MGYKAEKVLMELRRKGFDMTTREFYECSIRRVFSRFGIRERLNGNDMDELIEGILRLCAENDMKGMGLYYLDEDDWKDK